MPSREERPSNSPPAPDQRTPFQLDRDRLLYSAAFRRLAGVTQVVSPAEGDVFHSRLTHTLKVAQIARRLAEMFVERDRANGTKRAAAWGGIDPDVVEAAALAHDLGHPPFGHLAEKELNRLVSAELCQAAGKDPEREPCEGYEGNAQSFRIITALAVRRGPDPGLELIRAGLKSGR